jgi:transcriptional antiterminator NusG
MESHIFGLRTAANREDQVVDYLISKLQKDAKFGILAIIKAHGMRGYIFLEATSKLDAENALQGVPYARGILPAEIPYQEIEHMLEQVKVEMNIRKNDIVEIISGPFKRENAKVMRINKQKEEIVVELLESAVPIPITVKMDAVKVIRRDEDSTDEEDKE